MSTDLYVTVLAQWNDNNTTDGYASGNYEFVAAGQLMDSGAVAIVTPILIGQLDSLGAISLPSGTYGSAGDGTPNSGLALLASDNFGAGELLWTVKIVVEGVANISASGIIINYADGATQGLFTILEANGWSATATAQPAEG
jgi:hypothetical protein